LKLILQKKTKENKKMIKKSLEVIKALFFFERNENNIKIIIKPTVNKNLQSSEEDCSYHYWLNLSC
jgi:hypothetical protein